MRDTAKNVSDFVESERKRFSPKYDNLLASSAWQMMRYYAFLELILERYETASSGFVAMNQAIAAISRSAVPLSSTQSAMLERQEDLAVALHLEIESFYLFAKILLDKVAHFIEFYFGPARGQTLDSHDQLVKNLPAYSKVKGIVVSEEYLSPARTLKSDISDFRDYTIAHEKSPRTIRGTAFSSNGRAVIISTQMYPSQAGKMTHSKMPNDLFSKIDRYLESVVAMIRLNRDKTALELGAYNAAST